MGTELKQLPFDAPIAEYAAQADRLLEGWRAGDESAIRVFRSKHPTFLDEAIPWLERNLSDAELEQRLRDLKEELFNLRFQNAAGQLDNPLRLRQVRRDIARIRTVQRERELRAGAAARAAAQGREG